MDHPDNERGDPLPPLYGLLFQITSKESFVCAILQTGQYIPLPVTPVAEH